MCIRRPSKACYGAWSDTARNSPPTQSTHTVDTCPNSLSWQRVFTDLSWQLTVCIDRAVTDSPSTCHPNSQDLTELSSVIQSTVTVSVDRDTSTQSQPSTVTISVHRQCSQSPEPVNCHRESTQICLHCRCGRAVFIDLDCLVRKDRGQVINAFVWHTKSDFPSFFCFSRFWVFFGFIFLFPFLSCLVNCHFSTLTDSLHRVLTVCSSTCQLSPTFFTESSQIWHKRLRTVLTVNLHRFVKTDFKESLHRVHGPLHRFFTDSVHRRSSQSLHRESSQTLLRPKHSKQPRKSMSKPLSSQCLHTVCTVSLHRDSTQSYTCPRSPNCQPSQSVFTDIVHRV